jgi:hypothetical protein
MNKLTLRLIALALFTLCAVFTTSLAQAQTPDYRTVYMVKDNASHDLSVNGSGDYHYSTNQTPWAYIKLALTELNVAAPLHVLWSWSNIDNPLVNETEIQNFTLSATDKEIWTPAPGAWWAANGGHGKWSVDVGWLNNHGSLGTSTADFTVTPEPISTALFLFGGVPMALGLLRRKNKTA